MRNWKQIANYSVIDNAKAQVWWNRIGHCAMTWIIFPGMMMSLLLGAGVWLLEGMSRQTLVNAVIWGPGSVFMAAVGYGYYVPKGYRRYFYVVCAAPAVIGLLLSIACIVVAVISGFPTVEP